jgi:GMP synthase (glutamine-hydrolysing)
MRPLAILVTGDPVSEVKRRLGGFAALVRRAAEGAWSHGFVEVECRSGERVPSAEQVSAFVITGSASSVMERAPWMLELEAELGEAVAKGAPVLGICFGHQILAQALGGRVGRNPRGREIGTVSIERIAPDRLLDPSPPRFMANMTHVDAVLELPPDAVVVARSELDPNAAIHFADRVWGVQFHPEMDGDVIGDYVRARSDAIAGEGLSPEAILASTRDAPEGRAVLHRFLSEVARWERACTAGGEAFKT